MNFFYEKNSKLKCYTKIMVLSVDLSCKFLGVIKGVNHVTR